MSTSLSSLRKCGTVTLTGFEKRNFLWSQTHTQNTGDTAKAPPGIKQKFLDDLQDAIGRTPASDILLLLGDFNTRVGKSTADDDEWRGVRGGHGVGCCNEAGERFLEFCTVNNFTIMNTWFTKKPMHLATWKHPATKQSFMIDYIVMRAGQRKLCTDVQVMRGATCWSDHHMKSFPCLRRVEQQPCPLQFTPSLTQTKDLPTERSSMNPSPSSYTWKYMCIAH